MQEGRRWDLPAAIRMSLGLRFACMLSSASSQVKVGLGDGGAHLGVFQEASCPTFMLTHYVRDRVAGERIPLAEAIRLQTMDTAHLLGMKDRGVLAVGLRADINVIDLENLKLNVPYMADDLPSKASRWMQTADGYKMTLLAGVVTFEDGQPTGALPGRLVRAPLRPHLNVTPYEQLNLDAIAGPEPKSTHDTMLAAEDLVGGASAMKTALNANTDAMKARAQAGATGMSAVRARRGLCLLLTRALLTLPNVGRCRPCRPAHSLVTFSPVRCSARRAATRSSA